MSTSILLFTEHTAEIRAHVELATAANALGKLIDDPSNRRFARSRAARMEYWLQVETIAHRQLEGLKACAKAPAGKRRAVRVAPSATEPPVTAVAATETTS